MAGLRIDELAQLRIHLGEYVDDNPPMRDQEGEIWREEQGGGQAFHDSLDLLAYRVLGRLQKPQ
jgi:hypothetical protein